MPHQFSTDSTERRIIELPRPRVHRRRPRIALRMATVTLVGALVTATAAVIGPVSNYLGPPRRVERIANDILHEIAEQTATTTRPLTFPSMVAYPDGPDLVVRAKGPDITMTSTTDGVGNTSIKAVISGYLPGRYRLSASPEAYAFIAALRRSLAEASLTTQSASPAQIDVIGCADGMPVLDGALYSGDLGPVATTYYSSVARETRSLVLAPGITPLTNERIAALRAYDAAQTLRTIPGLANATFSLSAELSPDVGSGSRSTWFVIRLPGALQREYSELPPLLRGFARRHVS